MVKEIIWSHKARIKLFAILEFYAQRNGNKKYSAKLYKIFNKELKLLIRNPQLGIQSSKDNIRGLIVLDYIIFYECNDFQLIIHTIWPTNQNPNDLII
ncbi:type II toxin-antitoxin system RelE/ParE family toxin [Pedobacter sp. ISL-68]|uniref:type II toxin-antitoxin system RelE/ParE family toxin n=1 Tax=unclassified Pedobacter TaxID=2628915 RepID=UPI001BE83C64|nr:type II toxin-antitoxin system RelE/ParE family toxin [Pedobacter sp. ISL-64]MBT2559972.1 type II toxin-antitoxin system RelE/ParE family toxin [Pedobacter sp. ISL-64]MBT2592277.1 type II toxin-antitoxin system RelE/ParE family toxin [Pedobacter sp. ISL-68]